MSKIYQKREYKLKPIEIPDDRDFLRRDFFAYGIFKKGQLAHVKIKRFVDYMEDAEISREIQLRDGVPFITNNESENITKGQKIFFIEGKEKEAYEAICNTEPRQFYEWGIVEIGRKEYNVLIGKRPGDGSSHHCDDNDVYMDSFDGKNDIYFSELFPFIRNELYQLDGGNSEQNEIFKLQMYYMLLWSAIDRYCSLKYDITNKQGDYLRALSEDPIFTNALCNTRLKRRKPIFSARDLNWYYFNVRNPYFLVNYYYTIRSNVVHRGKEAKVKKQDLRLSLEELLEIFEKMIDETFK